MSRLILASALVLGLLWPGASWAFPDNGVLDAFTGTDNTSPPNSNWTEGVLGAATGSVDLEDNAVTSSTNGVFGDAYWNVTTFGGDCEAYITVVDTASTAAGGVFCRLVNIGANTTDGYYIYETDGSSIIDVYRIDNGVSSKLGASISQAITVGDKIGIKTVGDQICAWFNDNGAGWVEAGCRTDATYSAGGSIGVVVTGTNTIGGLDDFGGGTVASGGASLQGSQGFLGAIR